MDDTYVATWLSSCVCGQLLSSVDGTGSLALFTSGGRSRQRGKGKSKTEYDKQQSQRGMQGPSMRARGGATGPVPQNGRH
jgi:hypothetical protein